MMDVGMCNDESAYSEEKVITIEDILAEPSNKICADCSTANPKWALTSHGAIICIKCSGIHRSLGVHVSKVQSCVMDEWAPAALRAMLSMGNHRHNAVFEATMAAQGARRPNATADIEAHSAFIHAKYVEQRYKLSEAAVDSPSIAPAPVLAAASQTDCPPAPDSSAPNTTPTSTPTLVAADAVPSGTHSSSAAKKDKRKCSKSSSCAALASEVAMVEYWWRIFLDPLLSSHASASGILTIKLVGGSVASRDINGKSDPYVVFHLGAQTIKSKVVLKTLQPVWNETLMLCVTALDVPLRVHVYDWDRLKEDDVIGFADVKLSDLAGGERVAKHVKLDHKGGSVDLVLSFEPIEH